MTIGVLQGDNKLEFVSDLDTVVVEILDTLSQPLGKVQLLLNHPPLLAGIFDRIVPVLVAFDVELPVGDFSFGPVFLENVACGTL